MLRSSMYQLALDCVDPDAIGLAPAAFERHLPELLRTVFSADDFAGLYVSDDERTCCPRQLAGMLLLQYRYNLSDRRLIERCTRDLGFRHALSLNGYERPPSQSSIVRFRSWVRANRGEDWLLDKSLGFARTIGVLDDEDLQAVDSTNMDCRGAITDTFNLISSGIRQVVRAVADSLGRESAELAESWEVSRYMGRSLKGAVSIDWSCEIARNGLVTEEVRDAEAVIERVAVLEREFGYSLGVDEAVTLLDKVAHQDIEVLQDGSFKIARRTGGDRTVSTTDPEARHGRKSASKSIVGFKTHVAGTVVSSFVTALALTDAATHDAAPTGALLAQLKAREAVPSELLGDGAYGTGANLRQCADAGVTLRTKLRSPRKKGLTKRDFDIDVDAMRVTCPAGHTTTTFSRVKDSDSDSRVPQFRFAKETCQACPLRTDCGKPTANGRGRLIKFNRFERELQQAKAWNDQDGSAETLRKRCTIERLLSQLVRMGMRASRYFSLAHTAFQAKQIAAAYNIQRAFTLLAQRS